MARSEARNFDPLSLTVVWDNGGERKTKATVSEGLGAAMFATASKERADLATRLMPLNLGGLAVKPSSCEQFKNTEFKQHSGIHHGSVHLSHKFAFLP